jgi:hypothetical protein
MANTKYKYIQSRKSSYCTDVDDNITDDDHSYDDDKYDDIDNELIKKWKKNITIKREPKQINET